MVTPPTTGGSKVPLVGVSLYRNKYPAPILAFPMGTPGCCTFVTLLYEWLRSLQRRLATYTDWSATLDSLYEVHKYCKLSRGHGAGCEAEPRRMAGQLRQDWHIDVYVLRYVSK
jgi:hypothetical protein